MIALDAHGADGGVDVVVRGGELSGVPVQVFGPPLTAITSEDDPALAARSRTDASIVKAARAVADGEADALVSAGPTGATLAAAVLHIKRIRGVHRPAVAALVPVPGGIPTLLLDAGADVVVTDGFTGNVALKLMEGTASTVTAAIRDAIKSSPVSAIGGLLIRSRVAKLREQIDPNATGGAILLGVRKPVVIAHGKSSAEGIATAIRLAQRIVDEQMVEKTATRLEAAGVLRSAPAASVAQPD